MDVGRGCRWRRALRLSGSGAAPVGMAPTMLMPRAGGARRLSELAAEAQTLASEAVKMPRHAVHAAPRPDLGPDAV